MKRFTNLIYTAGLLVALMGGAASCSEDAMVPEQEGVCDNYINVKISMTASSPTKTRAYDHPLGGENGDGREEGLCHENDIENLTLFKFRGGIDAPASTPVVKIGFKNSIGFTETDATHMVKNGISYLQYEIKMKVSTNYEFTNEDYFVVAANCGDFNAATLGELRDHLVASAWKGERHKAKASYTEFAMSNEGATQFHGGEGTKDAPYEVEVDIERVAARIDFAVNGSVVSGTERKYPVLSASGDSHVADFYLSHVRAFNVKMAPSYFIKRLSPSQEGTKYYLRDERSGALYGDDMQPMYVEEPTTWRKTAATPEDNCLAWYGNSALTIARREATWLSDLYRVHVGSGTGFTDGTTHDDLYQLDYYVVEYANENTMLPGCTNAQTTTGLLLRGTYQPTKVYGGVDQQGSPTVDADYAKGQTYWRYRKMAQDHDEAQVLYFSSEAAAHAYKAAHEEDVAETVCYKDAVSYYVVYLRHDATHQDPIADHIAPMEFAIVRNSIYRLEVSFSGPGFNHIPNDMEARPEGIRPYIYVMKWNYIEHPEIEI
ncbi:MAG: fimbria major subunit [Bacteroidales bacterium]|nr:fimbria major subunit [Candidatus Physcousia equi]